jgi:hypothetical protein
MIKNFEDYTAEIDESELPVMKAVVAGLKLRQHKSQAITAQAITDAINTKMALPKPFTTVRLRKIINYIRSHGVLPVVSTGRGYYVSYDSQEVADAVESLMQRAHAISNAANGMKRFLSPAMRLPPTK